MTSSLPPSSAEAARHQRRTHAVARLRHPNLVRMLPLPGGAGLSPVLGEARRLADFTLPAGTFKRFDLEQVVRLLLDVLSGLAALHEVVTDGHAFVHGEVSPQHIYVDQHGTARLVPLLNSRSKASENGYTAPEHLAGGVTDIRADVFSVGVMLWEALAGKRLFREPALESVRARLAEPTTIQLSARERWALPLCAIAQRAIATDPAARFSSALELSHAVASAVAQQLARVDTDAWQEEAPTPVFQPRLHLPSLRGSSPAIGVAQGPAVETDTAPPTASDDAAELTLQARRPGRGRAVLAAAFAALFVAMAWIGWHGAPRVWQELSSLPAATARPYAELPAAARPAAASLAGAVETISAAPVSAPSSAPTAAPSAGAESGAPSVGPAPSARVKLKAARPRDYGI